MVSVSLLQLPGEIRNRIYDLVVEESRVVIRANHPKKELASLQAVDPTQKHKLPRYRLSGSFTKTNADRSLLLTCRQMNQEAAGFVYGRTTFCFNTMNTIHKFLNVIPTAGAKAIESLEVVHRGYAEPQWTKDRVWKLRHDKKWKQTLSRIREQMKVLRRLSLDITFFDWPCLLKMDASWAKVLINFAGNGLDRVNIILEHDRFGIPALEAAAKQLGRRMMTPKGFEEKVKEDKLQAELEKKKKEQAQKKATNILNIVLPANYKRSATAAPPKKVVKNKGLEIYAKAEAPVAFC